MTLTQECRLLWGWVDPSGLAASALEQGVAEEETPDETAAAGGGEGEFFADFRYRCVAAGEHSLCSLHFLRLDIVVQ